MEDQKRLGRVPIFGEAMEGDYFSLPKTWKAKLKQISRRLSVGGKKVGKADLYREGAMYVLEKYGHLLTEEEAPTTPSEDNDGQD